MKTKYAIVIFTLLVTVLAISCNNGILNDKGSDPVQMTESSRSVTVSGNLLSNPSFEDGSISPWKSWDLAGGSVSIGNQAHNGSKSLKLPFRSGYSYSNYARIEVNNKLTKGNVYYYEAWVKMDGNPGRGSEVFCHLGLEDSNGSNVRSMFFRQEYVQNSWVKINGSFSYTGDLADSDKLFIYMGAYSGGGSVSNAYVDDVFLQDLGNENLKPFPQNDSMIKQTTPQGMSNDQMNEDITSLYQKWKDEYLVEKSYTNGALNGNFSGYVLLGEANGAADFDADSTSEAVGYAMLMMALMAEHDSEARMIFDKMYQLYVNFPSSLGSGLLSWVIPKDGDLGSHHRLASATDGDMDVAYALLLANDQWGGGPQGIPKVNTTYYDAAVQIINDMADHLIYDEETGPHFPRLGDSDDTYYKAWQRRAIRSSDFMVGHCELFYEVTDNYLWRQVADNMIKISEHIQAPHSNGLMPDFMWNEPGQWNNKVKSEQPGWSDEANGLHDHDCFWNACRYPFRIATARAHYYQYSGTQRIVNRINNWSDSDPLQIKQGYKLDGTPLESWAATAFSAPIMSCLMFDDDPAKLKRYWDFIKKYEPPTEGESTYYFQNSIKLFTMNLVAGNWWKPTGKKNARQGGPVNTAPQWQVNKFYNNGDLVSYSGSVWKNSYPHTSNSAWYPGAPGLWFWTKQ